MKFIRISGGTYDTLKWIGLILFPALAFFISSVGPDLGVTNPESVVRILNAVGFLIGTLIGVTSLEYNKEKKK